ncbi:hypothetical protein ES288_A02G015100v1 [Gossypium darwinii]|uniref:Uncharacterized protein n=1 Tax=Gossypium darwinii TaxID=34276 RepID=A0A5D2HA21_GOSDA|nr:hypothetical protein ES288_A02G015100v1 [Gossypium darwinii]
MSGNILDAQNATLYGGLECKRAQIAGVIKKILKHECELIEMWCERGGADFGNMPSPQKHAADFLKKVSKTFSFSSARVSNPLSAAVSPSILHHGRWSGQHQMAFQPLIKPRLKAKP